MSTAAEPIVLVASAEFTLKSSPVRRTLEQRLIDDLKFTLRRGELGCSRVEKEAARLVVFGAKDNRSAAVLCSRVFGVAYAAPAVLMTNPRIDDITQILVDMAQTRLSAGKSFAIRAHRATPGELSRREVELQGGSSVLRSMAAQGVRVDLDAPDVTFYVDLVGSDACVYSERLKGPGGLPLSAQWKMLAVLDCGPPALLAACAMMRRGCVVQMFIPVSNNIPEFAYQSQMGLAAKVGQLVTRPNYKAFVMEADSLLRGQGSAVEDLNESIRSMAVRFARENRFKGVVFGDISGHLSNLKGGHRQAGQLPVFYPLLGLEESDLTELFALLGLDGVEFRSGLGEAQVMSPLGGRELFVEELPVLPVREVSL